MWALGPLCMKRVDERYSANRCLGGLHGHQSPEAELVRVGWMRRRVARAEYQLPHLRTDAITADN